MINFKQARKFCKEDISLIENYEQASKDLLETWDIHHRMENEGYSSKELKDRGMYYGRPACELVFLTKSEHISLHCKMRTGEKNPNYGKHLSEESRRKISEAQKGENNHMYGKHHSEKTKEKLSEANKGEKHPFYGKTGEKCHNSKPLLQIDKQTGEIIKTWPCTWEVQRVLGINRGNISECCLGNRKSAGGYIWRYSDSTSQKNCRKN